MLRALQIWNFKCFGEETCPLPESEEPHFIRIPLRRLTMFFGGNSSGKSSALQALLLLAQHGRSGRPGLRTLHPSGDLLQGHAFDEYLHAGRKDLEVMLGWELNRFDYPHALRFYFGTETAPAYRGHLNRIEIEAPGALEDTCTCSIRLHIEVAREGGSRGSYDVSDVAAGLIVSPDSVNRWLWGCTCAGGEADLLKDKSDVATVGSVRIDLSLDERAFSDVMVRIGKYIPGESTSGPMSFQFEQELFWRDAPEAFSGLPEVKSRLDQLIGMVIGLVDQHRAIGERFAAIGPLRDQGATPFNVVSELTRGSARAVGIDGSATPDVLDEKERLQMTNALMKAMGIGYEIRVLKRSLPAGEQCKWLEVCACGASSTKQGGKGHRANGGTSAAGQRLVHVGCGVSQLIPILAQIAVFHHMQRAEQESDGNVSGQLPAPVLVVEQPELHLHPSWQVRLASIFSGCATGSSMLSSELDVRELLLPQIIVETHSESMMLRIQRLVRQPEYGDFGHEDLSVVVFSRSDQSGFSVDTMEVDSDGEFEACWPTGFFPEREQEIWG